MMIHQTAALFILWMMSTWSSMKSTNAMCIIADGECSYGEVCLTVDQDNAQVCVNGTWEDVLDENCSVFANKTALCVYSVAHITGNSNLTYNVCGADLSAEWNMTVDQTLLELFTTVCSFPETLTLCSEGSVRLVNGSSQQEGRVEVCINGIWGSVCDEGWDTTDAHVLCQQLGYSRQEPLVFQDSYFGDGSYPIVYSNVDCKGWEDGINDCYKNSFLDYTCPRGHTAGVRCNGDIADRQTGSDSSSSIVGGVLGTVMFLVIIVLIGIIVILVVSYLKKPKNNTSQYQADRGNNPEKDNPPAEYEEMDYVNNPSKERPRYMWLQRQPNKDPSK